MEFPYTYNLSPEFDPLVFWKTVFLLDGHYHSSDQKIFEDPLDGTLLKKYISDQGSIPVHCDWDIGAVFVDSTIPLGELLSERGNINGT